MTRLADLLRAETEADAARRALGAVPEALRPPGAAQEAWVRCEQAHAGLQAALHDPEPQAGW